MRLQAYAGRYGACGPDQSGAMTLEDLAEYCEELGQLLEEESRPRGGDAG